MTLQAMTDSILPILEDNGVLKAGIFGSYATGDERQDSDLDVLVELPADKSLLDLVGLKQALESELSKNVDVLTYDAIHPLLKDSILSEQVVIYEKKT